MDPQRCIYEGKVMALLGLCDCGKLLHLIVNQLIITAFLVWFHFLFLYGTH